MTSKATGRLPDDRNDAVCGPLRLCAVTRLEKPRAELLRFVADPSGRMVTDPGAVLPGRGVWVTAERAALAEALKAKVFARSLKRQVTVDSDLADQVEAMFRRRALDALSIARKAGSVTTGFAQVDAAIEAGDAVALFHAADAAEGGRDKLDRKFKAIRRDSGLPAVIEAVFTIEEMSLAIGRTNVVHAALKRGGATDRLLHETGRFARYRSNGFSVKDTALHSPTEG